METRKKLSLSGDWKFAMDPLHQAINLCGGWYDYDLPDTVTLPGTTDSNHRGVEVKVMDTDHPYSRYQYVGSAWYQKMVDIPEELAGKRITLIMERTARTQVWVDQQYIGRCDRLQVPQRYPLGRIMGPGCHKISIECDNSPARPMQFGGYRPNGVIGDIYLEVTDQVWIESLKCVPDPKRKRVLINLGIGNFSRLPVEGELCVSGVSRNGKYTLMDQWVEFRLQAEETSKIISFEFLLGDTLITWDEFEPNLYDLSIRLMARPPRSSSFKFHDVWNGTIGIREFKANGTQININDRPIFLRGDQPGSMWLWNETNLYKAWKEKLALYKQYGINHLRFHTSCPTEEAFRAADEAGIYFQVELPFWASIAAPDSEQYEPLLEPTLKRHAEYLLQEYGNHPSFCMFAIGNEENGYRDTLEKVVDHLREYDPTRLYAQGSNNLLGRPRQSKTDDFWVTAKLHEGPYPVRGSFGHCDQPLGPVQDEVPNTLTDFTNSMVWSSIPVIGHEVGQYETSPNFEDIGSYPEDLIPGNLILFREKMRSQGLLDLEKEFFKATGKLALDCYRQDIEMALRTRGFAGFQLLSLSDFVYQGSSMVGILNSFMESKNMVTPEQWRQFCAPQVLLLRFARYTWYSTETFTAWYRWPTTVPG